jgi:fatty-acyl-CoA synthase
MLGNMMQQPLLISSIIRQAATLAPNAQIVSRRIEGDIHRYTFADCYQRSCRLAHALRELGIESGDRIGTLAWNGYRHVELYYAISGIGAIVHTVNPRLFAQQIEYIVNHAEDNVLFVDLTFVPLLNELAGKLPSVKLIVLLCDEDHAPAQTNFNFVCYESLLEDRSEAFDWPEFDENNAACLCYTSGTTGNPKGVLYSHRSTVIHALASCTPNALNLSRNSVVLPVVPMYHVSAWGLPYSGLIAGCKLVLPGAQLDGASLFELIEKENVNLALGVPTVWLTLLEYLDKIGRKLPSEIIVAVGGAAAPLALAEALREKHGVYLMPLWGMTETSPLATFGGRTPEMEQMTIEQRNRIQTSAGRAIYGIELEIFDDDDNPLPHNGRESGQLRVRGSWVMQRYFRADDDATINGWFDTGDVATLDSEGYLRIVDRKKDVVKSGGEWISSIALENAALSHDSVREACVIGVPHKKWDERPLLLVVLVENHALDKKSITAHLAERVAKWWLPDDIVAVDELPHTATGKLHKVPLREKYRGHYQ